MGYRGEVMFKFKSSIRSHNPLKFWWHFLVKKDIEKTLELYNNTFSSYNVGDRIGQLVIVKHPYIKLVEVDELSETERGAGGYGSTGK